MSTPIQNIPDESGMVQCNEEDPAVVQSILDEIGVMDTSDVHEPMTPPPAEPVYEPFENTAPPASNGGNYMPLDDDLLEFGGEDDYEPCPAPAAMPRSWKDRLFQLARVPLLAAVVLLVFLSPPVQALLRTKVLARLPVSDTLRALLGSMVVPAVVVAVVVGVAQVLMQ